MSTALQTVRRHTEITQYLVTLSTSAWTPQSLTFVQLASTDLKQQHRAATCSRIDSPINSPPRHLLKLSSYRTTNQFNLSNLSAYFPCIYTPVFKNVAFLKTCVIYIIMPFLRLYLFLSAPEKTYMHIEKKNCK